MRMSMMLGKFFVAGAAMVVLASCGQTDTAQSPDASGEDVVFEDADLTQPTPTPIAAPPPQSCEIGAYCAGPLIVRAENLTLSKDSADWLNVIGTLTFANRSDQDLRIALMREDVVMNLDKGARVGQSNFRYITGLGICSRDGSECFNTTPDTFTLVAPGDSPAQLNIFLGSNGRPDAALAPVLTEIASGTLTMSAYTVAADGTRRLHRISLANVPVTNQLAQ